MPNLTFKVNWFTIYGKFNTKGMHMDISQLGAVVKETRRAASMSQATLASRAMVGFQTVVRIEAGNGGVSADNMRKVLDVLGLTLSLPTAASTSKAPALHGLHIDSDQVDETVHRAVSAACAELDFLFPGAKPEVNGVSTNFAGLLEAHIKAMLCGEQASTRFSSRPSKLVWQESDLGRPFSLPEGANGYLVMLPGTKEVLEPSNSYRGSLTAFRPAASSSDLFSSWFGAVQGVWQYLADCGNLNEVPVILPGVFLADRGVAVFEDNSQPA